MIIIGVTGNIGAGKSTVSTIIKNNTGAFVINADFLASQLMDDKQEYYNDIIKLFGESIVRTGKKWKNKINKEKIANEIFTDSEKREKLNKLTFKYVGKKTKELILSNQDKEIIVLDFPLLYEGGFDKICNCVIGVFADDITKIERIKERDKITASQVQERLDIQISDDKLREMVDYTVDNSKDINYFKLVKDVVRLVHKIKKDEEEKKEAQK